MISRTLDLDEMANVTSRLADLRADGLWIVIHPDGRVYKDKDLLALACRLVNPYKLTLDTTRGQVP